MKHVNEVIQRSRHEGLTRGLGNYCTCCMWQSLLNHTHKMEDFVCGCVCVCMHNVYINIYVYMYKYVCVLYMYNYLTIDLFELGASLMTYRTCVFGVKCGSKEHKINVFSYFCPY